MGRGAWPDVHAALCSSWPSRQRGVVHTRAARGNSAADAAWHLLRCNAPVMRPHLIAVTRTDISGKDLFTGPGVGPRTYQEFAPNALRPRTCAYSAIIVMQAG